MYKNKSERRFRRLQHKLWVWQNATKVNIDLLGWAKHTRQLTALTLVCCRRIADPTHQTHLDHIESEPYNQDHWVARDRDCPTCHALAYHARVYSLRHQLCSHNTYYCLRHCVFSRPKPEQAREEAAQADLFRDIIHPSPPDLHPALLVWNDGTVAKLARTIHQDGTFECLPVLGDALEEAGCTNAEILNHARQQPHTNHCWLVDLILELDKKSFWSRKQPAPPGLGCDDGNGAGTSVKRRRQGNSSQLPCRRRKESPGSFRWPGRWPQLSPSVNCRYNPNAAHTEPMSRANSFQASTDG